MAFAATEYGVLALTSSLASDVAMPHTPARAHTCTHAHTHMFEVEYRFSVRTSGVDGDGTIVYRR